MLYYDETDISKGIDSAKHVNNKECMVCHYWFLNHGFKYQDSASNGCHEISLFHC